MRSLASLISSQVIPRPRSVIVMRTPREVNVVAVTTRVSGFENWVAFSSSSASRCAAVSATCPTIGGSACSARSTRS